MSLKRRRNGATDPEKEALRELGQRLARESYPDAAEIRVNPQHEGGPIVEVFSAETGGASIYQLVGYEL